MDLNEIRVFVRVAQSGSFTAAAKALQMPKSTVSAKVALLEERLGVRLLQRTTRKLSLTESGENYFRHCRSGIEEILSAESELGAAKGDAQGLLRITAPVDLGSGCLVELIRDFRKTHPKVKLEFLFTDRVVDLVDEGMDLGIRAGELGDSSLRSKKLGVSHWAAYASPKYLKRFGEPTHPKELTRHECILFSPLHTDQWELTQEKTVARIPMNASSLRGNELGWVKSLVVSGQGIALLPSFLCRAEIRRGELSRVLPKWKAASDPMHLVYPEQRFLPPKVRVFIDASADFFSEILAE